jgi:hypothetical protein
VRRTCFQCGYDISDRPFGGKCPECGNPGFDDREVFDRRARNARWWRWLKIAIALAMGLYAFVILVRLLYSLTPR